MRQNIDSYKCTVREIASKAYELDSSVITVDVIPTDEDSYDPPVEVIVGLGDGKAITLREAIFDSFMTETFSDFHLKLLQAFIRRRYAGLQTDYINYFS
jgi:hypothetical protein